MQLSRPAMDKYTCNTGCNNKLCIKVKQAKGWEKILRCDEEFKWLLLFPALVYQTLKQAHNFVIT